jgi:hypothetical protein
MLRVYGYIHPDPSLSKGLSQAFPGYEEDWWMTEPRVKREIIAHSERDAGTYLLERTSVGYPPAYYSRPLCPGDLSTLELAEYLGPA